MHKQNTHKNSTKKKEKTEVFSLLWVQFLPVVTTLIQYLWFLCMQSRKLPLRLYAEQPYTKQHHYLSSTRAAYTQRRWFENSLIPKHDITKSLCLLVHQWCLIYSHVKIWNACWSDVPVSLIIRKLHINTQDVKGESRHCRHTCGKQGW